jgi:hypothetical protein
MHMAAGRLYSIERHLKNPVKLYASKTMLYVEKVIFLNIFHLMYNSGTAEQDIKYGKIDPVQIIVIMGEYRYNSTYSLPQH